MEYQDKDIACIDCRTDFPWTAAEQSFMQGLVENENVPEVTKLVPPKRCKECRAKRKQLFTRASTN